ncbi:MAG TPA: PQQ-dependent sugar dehydrogenase [Candidatus Limnocylindria bacterium]|nr:PQQ-dependent sugar dehydrogenase [Candidatus Limnocylindria bacterium]
MNLRRVAASVMLLTLVSAAMPSATLGAVSLQFVQGGYSSPVFVTHAGDSRLFVVEQTGRIKIVGGGTFLDIHTMVKTSGGEQGLLGLAFHPNYASNGLFYVNYTRKSDGDTVIAEFKRSTGNPDVANVASKRVVLTINQPYPNHNGGWIGFRGSYLYIATGDGGGGGDQGNRAQNLDKLLGKILRINPLDPDGSGSRKYSVPADNPFVGVAGNDAVWAYGLRNPWRCSFDSGNGDLYCGDVGQDLYEEIDHVDTGRGVNFGWRKLEGNHYYNWPGHSGGTLCSGSCFTLPIAEIPHSESGDDNCAITGGYVSRRSGANMFGDYIFGDFCSGKMWVIPSTFSNGDTLPAPDDTGYSISSFGEGFDGKLYMVDLGGAIYRLTDS